MDNSNNSNNNNINNNITSQEIGVDCNIVDNNLNVNEIDITNHNDNNVNIQNQSNQINENNIQPEEEIEEDEEQEENEEEEENDDNNNNNLVQKENFSQQVDFLYHPDNPEWQTNIKVTKKKNLKKIIKKSKSNINKKLPKKNKSKSKNKNRRNKVINKIRPEFNLCTKIDPQPKTEPLFYGKRDETRYEKQRKERAQKIAEYEEDFSRQKEIYKAKRKKEEEELKNRYNYLKNRTSYNFYRNYPKQNINDDFLKQFKNISKIEYPNTDIRKYECNPQKYDAIIHSLLSEISEIKFQRKKENEDFVNQIKRLQNDLDENKNKKKQIKKRPKSGNKIKINKKKSNKNNNNLFNIINNYYKPYKPRPKTGNKLKNKNNNSFKKKENEIPVNSSKNSTKNNYYKIEKEKLSKEIQDLEEQKNIIKSQMINQNYNINENNIDNYYNNNNIIKNSQYNPSNSYNKSIIQNGSQNQNVMNLNNIIYNPVQFNIIENINPKTLNYQDKMQILTELNNNISKFTSGIPKLVNKVNQTLDKIYGNTDNPIKKAINNHPFVALASKSAFQIIKANSDIIIEEMINDLLLDLLNDLQEIEYTRKENLKRNNLMLYLNEACNKLNIISQNEQEILNNYNLNSRNK